MQTSGRSRTSGVILVWGGNYFADSRRSRTSGGDPSAIRVVTFRGEVVPAQAGVILKFSHRLRFSSGRSRTSGGDPTLGVIDSDYRGSFPHKRG